ncbi:Pilin (type 1 fimbria component protein) [Cupriavidus sp. YR651]|uniref:fimbrial protein n=1 Tax=Cupriavidus sp. YR651 TaxID=1855315 RepID=UPI000883B312|nr:fimbrial protein [Cupriavidus sp. YR651]SDC00559.1 Pilin (type 1 fimbria component protein) [Cupriavidus sp. YR651]
MRNIESRFGCYLRLALKTAGPLLVLFCASENVAAQGVRCTSNPSFALPSLNANMFSAAIGTPISPWAEKHAGGVQCRVTVLAFRDAHLGMLYLNMPGSVATYRERGVTYDVFPTNVSGIGYVLGYQQRGGNSAAASGFCSPAWRPARAGQPEIREDIRVPEPCRVFGRDSNVLSGGREIGQTYINFSYSVRVRFIRIAGSLGSGSIQASSLGSSCYREYGNRGPQFSFNQEVYTSFGRDGCFASGISDSGPVRVPAAPTCTLATAHRNRTIAMQETRVRDFTRKGDTTVPTPVAFRFTCQNATRLSYSFTGELADATIPSVLRNRALGVRAATGIGIQLVDADNGDTPVTLNASTQVTGSVNTTRDLNFKLRYFSLEDRPIDMKPGVVEAQATITLTFQ